MLWVVSVDIVMSMDGLYSNGDIMNSVGDSIGLDETGRTIGLVLVPVRDSMGVSCGSFVGCVAALA